ncbi:integral membrane sensor signal transduction histidine kinase [Niallia circulans]|nr:sensor histidine kinase [Niallia circulans]MED3836897.1 histidine kinase [Niallia circulans]MED4244888.1 histidine kinase [Niallia circulans]MED4249299.1 histidine kinase [Niallia circulans]QKH60836.1 histidine kinase [Niallia circulans]SPU12184.1 integral membrane sensor signal transduction histidine kinase [Niallia circulans]
MLIWLKNMWTPRSFRYKVLLISIISLVIPAVISLLIYNYMTKNTVKEQALSNANRELNITSEYIEKLFSDMLYVANFVQLDPKMNTVLKGLAKSAADKDGYDQYLLENEINRTIENITLVGEKSYVTILLKNRKYFTNYNIAEFDPRDLFKEKWYEDIEEAVGYESTWIESQPTIFELEKKNNPYQISIVRTLRDEGIQIYGYVVVTIMENKLSEVFNKMDGYNDVMMLNPSGKILSHSDDEKIGSVFTYRSKLFNRDGSEVLKMKDNEYIVTERSLSFSNWRLVSFIPYEQSINKINGIFQKVFLIQVLSFILFLLLLTYSMKTITKPLEYLAELADKVQAGNLIVRSKIKGKDEIGRLSKSINLMLDHINTKIEEITETEARKRKAEFAMLQAQINPHFLFNVLNSIRMKVMIRGDKESANMITSLTKLLRITIDKNKEIITFLEEIEILVDFVHIMNRRQNRKVSLEMDVDPDAYSFEIPRFILQPIIENSIIHGFNQSDGLILIHAAIVNEMLIITIEDNGLGMNKENLEQLKKKTFQAASLENPQRKQQVKGFSSLGLANVYERLSITFGPAFNMDILSELGNGTKVILKIPMKGGKKNV